MKNGFVIPVLFSLVIVVGCTNTSGVVSFPADEIKGITKGTLEDVGLDRKIIEVLVDSIESGYYTNRHSLLIYKDHKLVLEEYFSGKDEEWAKDLGIVEFNDSTLHDLRSISKSVVSAALGIAIEQGLIKSVDQKIFDFFPQYKQFNNEGRQNITIKHLLTMTSGLQWNEEVPYDNPENSEAKMIQSEDGIAYVLSQKIMTEPGTVYQYNGGATEVLAAIIARVSGLNIHDFSREYLFIPMGITQTQWVISPATNTPAAASGLRLTPIDILKFGILYLNGGIWEDRQLVPKQWIEDSFFPWVERPQNGGYGYQFWILNYTIGTENINIPAAVGNGDQRIFFDLEDNMLVVTTAGNYNKWELEHNASEMFKAILSAKKGR